MSARKRYGRGGHAARHLSPTGVASRTGRVAAEVRDIAARVRGCRRGGVNG
ncbi:hypothetical protein [Actinomadura sp. DC4]|uniref:hypothetical protein n=1 Tax=Actinomadura sp. DC4 TaxID=3055069 RepID=UPI0025B0DABE|nr:hypothetical protein [Actinomadura sp. DC4]MDN3358046.1 hypothetical protein [Actinomadura sp. DC4]